MSWEKRSNFAILLLTTIVAIGFLVPQNLKMPVVGADCVSGQQITIGV